MKAFLTYKFDDDPKVIVTLLNEMNVQIFDAMSDLNIGTSLQQAIKNALRECDFVVVIYSSESPNITFEAGVAFGLNKPIFSVISPNAQIPDILLDSAYVYALPNEVEKIRFNLSLFQKNIRPRKYASVKSPAKSNGGGEPIYFEILNNRYNTITKKSGEELEAFFKSLFDLYGISATQNAYVSTEKYSADFSIWSDALENIIGNPILIEIKGELNPNNLSRFSKNIAINSNAPGANSFLVFYESLAGLRKNDLPNNARCLFIEMADLLEKLRTLGFNEAIRKIRNEIAHNKM